MKKTKPKGLIVTGSRTNNPELSAKTYKTAVPAKESDSQAKDDSKYLTLSADMLPSGAIFYQYESISVRRFSVIDLKKICKAQATKSFRTLVEVINSTIDRSAFELTPGDFWFLMYWHRINSYISAPLQVEYHCVDPKHIQRIIDGELERESLQGTATLTNTKLRTQKIKSEQAIADKITHVQNTYDGLLVYPARMIDILEGEDMMVRLSGLEQIDDVAEELNTNKLASINIAKRAIENADEAWFNDYSSVLHPQYGKNLQEKREYFNKIVEDKGYGFELIQDIKGFMSIIEHGVIESIKCKCEVCGAKVETDVSTEALTFFPNLF